MRLTKNFLPYWGLIGKHFGSKDLSTAADMPMAVAKIRPKLLFGWGDFCILLTDRVRRNKIFKAPIRHSKNSFYPVQRILGNSGLTKFIRLGIIPILFESRQLTKTWERFFQFTLNQYPLEHP